MAPMSAKLFLSASFAWLITIVLPIIFMLITAKITEKVCKIRWIVEPIYSVSGNIEEYCRENDK